MAPRRAPVRDRTDDLTGTDVQPLFPYGVGVDTHKNFIQVCVLLQTDDGVRRYEREYETDWHSLQDAAVWARRIAKRADSNVSVGNLRYVIESTGTYHMPIVLAWNGTPSIINPMLAGPTKRKTDVLDARLLAHHSICGLWPSTYVPSRKIESVRLLIAQRFECKRCATRIGNRINNCVLRFGHTIGRNSSVRDATGRPVVEDLARGVVPQHEDVCPDGLPEPIRAWIKTNYMLYDVYTDVGLQYERAATKAAGELEWCIEGGVMLGTKLLRCLQSVPGVGRITSLTWLCIIGDPNRFANSKQVAAYVGSDPSLKVSAGKVTSFTKRRGNVRLHHVLKMCAAKQIHQSNSVLGAWGRLIKARQKHAGYGRAINAMARRLAIFLWHVHRVGELFDMGKYNYYLAPKVLVVPIEDMDLNDRFTKILLGAGLITSQDVADAMMSNLPQQKGIGVVCLNEIKKWILEHPVTVKMKPAA